MGRAFALKLEVEGAALAPLPPLAAFPGDAAFLVFATFDERVAGPADSSAALLRVPGVTVSMEVVVAVGRRAVLTDHGENSSAG